MRNITAWQGEFFISKTIDVSMVTEKLFREKSGKQFSYAVCIGPKQNFFSRPKIHFSAM